MSKTTPGLLFVRKGELQWREFPEPELSSAHSALVRPLAAARCDGDCLFLFNDFSRWLRLGVAAHWIDPEVTVFGKAPFAGPFAYGHECVAEVTAVGDAVQGVGVGDRVVVPFSVSCGACLHCKAGLTSQCLARKARHAAYGFGGPIGGWGGAVSDLLHVPFADGMLVKLPAGISPLHAASVSDNIPDAYRSVAPHLARAPGAPVLVLGGAARSVGLYAAAIAVALGSTRVDYIDKNQSRLAIAEKFGANPIQLRSDSPWFEKGQAPLAAGYPIVVDAMMRERGLDFAIRAASPGGVCTSVGYYFRKRTGLPLWHMYLKGAHFHIGVTNARAHIPAVLALMATGRFRPELVTTHVASWKDAAEALLTRDAAKVVVAREHLL